MLPPFCGGVFAGLGHDLIVVAIKNLPRIVCMGFGDPNVTRAKNIDHTPASADHGFRIITKPANANIGPGVIKMMIIRRG